MSPEVRILLLEDSLVDAELVERELRRSGIAFDSRRVDTVSGFTAALDRFRPHLVLSDNALPSFDALSALELTKRASPDSGFIVVSGTLGEERTADMLKSGVTDVVLKHHLDRLGPVVHRALAEAEQRAETRAATEAARQANERFRSAFQNAPAGLAVVDLEGTLVDVNESLCLLLGRPERELLGSLIHAHAHPHDRAALDAVFGRPLLAETPARPRELRLLRAGGQVLWVLLGVSVVTDAGGRPQHAVAQVVDITAAKEAEAKLLHQALYDPLTGLPNRVLIEDRLGHALDQCGRRSNGVTLLFLDLDHFKVVNDSLGHGAGDVLLVTVAERLQQVVRGGDTAGRFGGDEFVVVCEDEADEQRALALARRIAEALAVPCWVAGRQMTLSASVGIAIATDPGVRPQDLLRNADAAMYRAKEGGRARPVVFDEDMRVRAVTRLNVEADLRSGLERGDFVARYQPQLDLRTGRLVGFEALLRWQRPGNGVVLPDDFIGVAEDTGLIGPLGAWVLEEACTQAATWRVQRPDLLMSVNVSARQIASTAFVGVVAGVLERTGLPPANLCLEVTESVLVVASATTVETLDGLRKLGVGISIDDFGTGYASLSYLVQFRPDVLKIDKLFVQGLHEPMNAAIAEAVVHLAHRMGLTVVAEGVEHDAALRTLTDLGCDVGQGYLFSEALPAAEAERLLAL